MSFKPMVPFKNLIDQPSKARLDGVHFIFWHIQIRTRLLQGKLFKVTKYTAYISSNGNHFLMARGFGALNI